MQYLGGKFRIAPVLSKFIQPYVDKQGCYVEPFVGSGAMLCKVRANHRVGADINYPLITMWKALAAGWIPPSSLSEEEYSLIKKNRNPEDPLTAFAGFGCSFSGMYFGSYAKNKRGDNYARNTANGLLRKMTTLTGVQWVHSSYENLDYPPGCVVYCDPPYAGTAKYNETPDMDYSKFWQFYRDLSKRGHLVFISEYRAPSDFQCVLEIETKTEIRGKDNQRLPRTERLFTASL